MNEYQLKAGQRTSLSAFEVILILLEKGFTHNTSKTNKQLSLMDLELNNKKIVNAAYDTKKGIVILKLK